MPLIKRNNHLTQHQAERPAPRKASGSDEEIAMYKTATWQRLREKVLRSEPLCRSCKKKGITKAARVVDHITPARTNEYGFYDESNLQPLCDSCHNRKSAKERNQ